ncbi:MAG: recombinase family protein [Saccharofermentanales bacterium]|jgi:DNA invertase Pin-like site-specific DNA recombinase
MKAVGYIRVGTNGQAEHSDGVVMQREDILDHARRNNYEVVDWFVDEGHSGADDRRPAFDEIIYGEVTNPPYEVVLVASSDRVSSNINVYYYFKYLLDKKDIKLVAVREDFGPNGALRAYWIHLSKPWLSWNARVLPNAHRAAEIGKLNWVVMRGVGLRLGIP